MTMYTMQEFYSSDTANTPRSRGFYCTEMILEMAQKQSLTL